VKRSGCSGEGISVDRFSKEVDPESIHMDSMALVDTRTQCLASFSA